ncbi:MAG: GNAT family N-acetyltransferase [Candidatus Krumholzibacteriia bacterium]
MEISIRRATINDLESIVAFNAAMAKETEARELSVEVLSRGVRSVLDDAAKGFYLVAETGGTTAGGLLVTDEWSDWHNAYYWWIQSVYVRPQFRGRGVYQRLHRVVEEMAAGQGVCGIRLYVDRGNERAKNVYRRLGMTPARYEFYETSTPGDGPDFA